MTPPDMTTYSQNNLVTPVPLLSVVVPLYNEESVLKDFHKRLNHAMVELKISWEVIYVNDGSGDSTLSLIRDLQQSNSNVTLIDLSRNFGKEIALTAGLDHANGDAVVVIDADLQDPPELISKLLEMWHAGYDIVSAVRSKRRGESWLKKFTAYGFYRIIGYVNVVSIPHDTGDFRLLSRRAVLALRQLRERHRFMKGLFVWIGYRQTNIVYERDARHAGQSKWSYWRLWNFALDGISSLTTFPLKLSTYIGLITACGAFLYGLIIVGRTLIYGNPVAGYPSMLVVVLFLGGIQLMSLGVMGEYLGRMFDETKQRPLYLIATYEPASDAINVAGEMSVRPLIEGATGHLTRSKKL